MPGLISNMQLTPRSKLLFLIGVFVVPVVAAYLAFYGWRPSGHTNYGVLLAATPLKHTPGNTLDGNPYNLESLRGKWVMVHAGEARCDSECVQQLYLMRQTRIAQGKGQSRIERLWVLTDAGTPDAKLLKDYPGLHVWRPQDPSFMEQLPADRSRSSHIYLVDPLGNLMLRFPEQPDHRGIMKDLKLLLKASQIG